MNRLAGFFLIGGLLASSAAASGANASQVPNAGIATLGATAVQESVASVEQALPASVAPLAPSKTTQRIIHASQVGTRTALPPAAAELAPASQASPCPPARTEVACRKP